MKEGGAAKGELVLAMYELANSFQHGWGVEKDPVAARSYYETAANLGDTDAMNEVARCYEEGFGGKKDKVSGSSCFGRIFFILLFFSCHPLWGCFTTLVFFFSGIGEKFWGMREGERRKEPQTRELEKSVSMTGLPTRGSQPDFQFSFLSSFWFQGEERMGWTVAYSPCLKFFSFVYEARHTSVGLLGSNAFFFFFAD